MNKYSILIMLLVVTTCNGKEKTNFSIDKINVTNKVHIEKANTNILWDDPYLLANYIFNDSKSLSNMPNDAIHAILEDKDGNIWFGTWNGLYRFNASRKNYPCNKRTCKHLFTNPNDLYFHNIEIAKSYTNFTYNNDINDVHITSLLEDNAGNIWFGTSNAGIGLFDKNEKKIKYITESNGLNSNNISCLLIDKKGNIWIGTDAGVCIYDGNSFTKFTTNDGLNSNSVTTIMEDKSGDIWFGSNSGVSIFNGKSFTNFCPKGSSKFKNVKSIIQDKKGNIWIGGEDGVCYYDGKKINKFTTQNGLSHNVVSSIFEDNEGNIWLSVCDNDLTGGGLCLYDGKSFKYYTEKDGLSNNRVFSFLIDKQKHFWLGSSHGVSNLKGVSFTNFINRDNGNGC